MSKRTIQIRSRLSFTLDKIETKREMLCNYQLEIADLYNIPFCNVKN